MELSIAIAQILAIIYLATGVAAIRGVTDFGKIVKDFDKSPALTFITGFITVTIGVLLVTYHNIWVKDWTVIITIIGWIAVVKGIMFIAFPGAIQSFKKLYKNTQAWGLLLLAIGGVFTYFGFVV